jgi:urease accessory protein
MTHRTYRLGLFEFSLLALAVFVPSLAQAHVGIGPTGGWTPGFTHPISGLDHICAMLAVGLLAGQRGGRALWIVPLTFLTLMAGGALLGTAGFRIPFVEGGVVLSVLVLGLLVAVAARLPLGADVVIVTLFALCHGHVHGTEMPATVSGFVYGAGFLAGTALLQALGIGLALLPTRVGEARVARFAGAAIALCGLYLFVA